MVEPTDLAIERLKRDRAGGLEEDLASALCLMIRVVKGEQTAERMGEWIYLNYPELRHQLPGHIKA